MAINRNKKPDDKPQLPEKLEELLIQGFSLQAARDMFGDAFKDVGKSVTDYFEHNTDGFSVDVGKGVKCEQGSVIYQSRNNFKFDVDEIVKLIAAKKVTLETVLNCASFSAEKMKTAIGSDFDRIATNTPTEFITFKATSEFKKSAQDKFSEFLPELKSEEVVEVKPVKPAKAEKSDAQRAKEIAAKVKKPVAVKSAEDDLADILGE